MKEDLRRGWGEASTLAFTLVGYVVGCMGLGYLVDRWAGTRPWFMIGGVFVGAGLGFAYLLSILFFRREETPGGDEGPAKGED
jgi:F0F1-type ATP synthase assembly protein I